MNPGLNDWVTFFTAMVGAASALVGLVVVAISINLTRILSFPFLPGRAAECLVILSCALILSGLALMPGQAMAAFGVEALAFGLAGAGVCLDNLIKQALRSKDLSMFKIFASASVSACSTLPLVVGGALLASGHATGLDWIGVGILFALGAGVMNTWVLLVEILR
jgi:modulator of FtsH protease